ncbi:hypothetical protein WJX72_006733 [[Myrmecia] bisecta]|uniref:Uncharacterized protein n=1 Tax=[Myrmecia] bisecta TaxID=41462 RepID=A0AAW1PYP3_9CHLO
MEKLKKQILGFKNWDASKKGRALNRLKGENLERFTGLPDDVLQAALDDELSAGAQDALETVHAKLDALKEDYPINTDAPLYSHFLARTMNMTAPYEQYTFWLAGFSSCAVAVVQLGKAYVAYRRKMSLDAAQQPQQRQHQTKQPPQQTTKGLQKS